MENYSFFKETGKGTQTKRKRTKQKSQDRPKDREQDGFLKG